MCDILQVTFTPGQSAASISVTITDDDIAENNQEIYIDIIQLLDDAIDAFGFTARLGNYLLLCFFFVLRII